MHFTNVKGILSAQNGMNYEIVTLDEKIVAGVKTVTNNSAADMQAKFGMLKNRIISSII